MAQNSFAPSRRTFLKSAALASAAALPRPQFAWAEATPAATFWGSDGVLPGDLAMLIGGGLEHAALRAARLDDAPAGTPGASAALPALDRLNPAEASDAAIKAILPAAWKPGIFALQAGDAAPLLLNRPLVWFAQPTQLQPGLAVNEAALGQTLQIVGKDLLLPDDSGKATLALKPAAGPWMTLPAATAERFSLLVDLPATLAEGDYQLAVHNGFGGPAGWSEPIAFRIRKPTAWPATVYDVRKMGAQGDDVYDDTEVIRKALKLCEANGGGIVYFAWGTYRLTGPIAIPARTVLRGEVRDGTILKWPEDEPASAEDMTSAAVYTASEFALEDLTLIARKVEHTVLDVTWAHTHLNTVPAEFRYLMRPWSRYRDIFLRRVNFQHWFNVSHPDRTVDPKMLRKYFAGDGPWNIRFGGGANIEISDCIFQGGNNGFYGQINGRVTGCSFSNEMNTCWTVLGGGCEHLVVERNDIRASSSFGFGSIGLQWVYFAHNTSHNFVRGEREAMTLDVSSMPTRRARAEYWGTPLEVTNDPGNVTLRFPPASAGANADGFRTGFIPGQFRGGQAIIRALHGGAGAGQTRNILDNTADTVTLDKPWNTPPETNPHPLYIELSPRKNENNGITAAWVGLLGGCSGTTLRAEKAHWVPDEMTGQCVLIFDGPGAGQYRRVVGNTEDTLTLDRAFDVQPKPGAAIGVWAITRHFIAYKSEAFDTSAFVQLYGSGYDFTADSCRVERNQGTWGQMGWFVQYNRNQVDFGMSYHKGIGPPGPTPEHNSPFGIVGLTGNALRLTKFGQVQYPEIPSGTAIFVDKLVGRDVPSGLATTMRRNHLRYNERLVLGMSGNTSAPKRFHHAVIDGNIVEHSAVAIEVGTEADGVVASANRFNDVAKPFFVPLQSNVKILS